MREHTPIMVWPLASYLAEEMEARGWTCVDVAVRMPGDYSMNVMIVNLIMAISGEKDFNLGEGVAEGLAQAFEVSTGLIDNLHDCWRRHPEAQQPFECPEHLFDGILIPANDAAPPDPRGGR